VVTKGAGAGVLKDLDLMVRLTEAVVKSTNLPVTVKTRLGWDDNTRNIHEVALRLQDVGIKALAIHGRTRTQMYKGEADWTLIGEIKNDPRIHIPIFGNGDINSPEKALEYKNRYGVDGIMIGRAAIGYPWIFREIKHFVETGTKRADPTIEERVEVARKHLIKSMEWKGPIAGINEMRRHYANYLRGLPNIKEYRNKLVRITDPKEVEAILDEIKETYKDMVIESGHIVLENYHEHCPIN
jgi:nifR3 family TIM-barrel protein